MSHRGWPTTHSEDSLLSPDSSKVAGLIVKASERDSLEEFARAVAIGLSSRPRWLPTRYLYDEEGSRLFEKISELPEYYQTRTEAAILADCAAQIRETTGPVTLIELGSGSSVKTDYLLGTYTAVDQEVQYVPVDVSESILRRASELISARHPNVKVRAINGTYESAFPLFKQFSPSMVLFLGSTVGNLHQTEEMRFWDSVSRSLVPGDFFLLGVDLVKDVETIEAAYNDSVGVTAEFTKNIFARINRELGAEIDVTSIEHVAQWNAEWRRIEISGRFLEGQEIRLAPLGKTFKINAGEEIITEICRKFEVEALQRYLECFDLSVERTYTDQRSWFALLLLQKK